MMLYVSVMFFRSLIVTAILLLGISTSALAQKAFDHATLARTALERHIRPSYARLTKAAFALDRALSISCPATTPKRSKAIGTAFDRLVDAWGRIEHIQFGPVTEDRRLERIYFWQDRRGIGASQIAKVIADRDSRLLDTSELAKRGVALQGIGALEIVLFGKGTASAGAEDKSFRCAYAHAIAKNLGAIAISIETGWSDQGPFARHWLTPGSGNPQYLQSSETTLALAKSFDSGLERLRDVRIVGPLGFNKQRRPTTPELVISGRSMRLIIANIAGVYDLFANGGLKSAMLDTVRGSSDTEVAAITTLADKELKTSLRVARELLNAVKPFVLPSAQRLIAIGFPLKNARMQGGSMLARTANLTVGFNSSDGD
jgi:predicted lipoprotein